MTALPIDYHKVPWRPKYLTEETPVLNGWFIFGEHPTEDRVDISDGNEDIFINVPRAIALEIIEARNALCSVVERHFCRFPK